MSGSGTLFKYLWTLIFLLFFKNSYSSHLYGGELYYTHLGSNLYKITLTLYADCNSSTSLISGLYSATPQVDVYKGTSHIRSMYLDVESGAGTEITPVCPSSLSSTSCSGGTLPGIRRFSYSDTITMNSSSSTWRIHFGGSLYSGTSAGRSSSITNLISPGSSIMALEATLNNASSTNSSPRYTTVPTPFFCINVSQEYNPGAVDSNATDSLVYTLIDALEASGGTVTYRTSYSGSSPLAYATGTFNFNTATGQLSFTPNLTQKSVVVYKVSEYRGGVLVGTSMREMNFIVLSSCTNKSPFGKISNANVGTIVSNTSINVCKNDTFLSFNINPVDSDGNNITLSVKGLPSGSSLAISYNGTDTPRSVFSWNTSSVSPGTYTFFITYQDDACPLNSKQTVAYTINLSAQPSLTIKIVSSLTCTNKEVIDITPGTSSSSWTYEIYKSGALIKSLSSSTSPMRDSLADGSYSFRIKNAFGCWSNMLNYTINPPPKVTFGSISIQNPKCYGDSSGRATITAATGTSPFTFSLDGGSYNDSGIFNKLYAKTYTISIKDAKNCVKDSTITLNNPSPVTMAFSTSLPNCYGDSSGKLKVIANRGSTPYTYRIDGGSFTAIDSFVKLYAKTYTVSVRDSNNCIKDSSFILNNPTKISISPSYTNPNCFGDSSGKIYISASGGYTPYLYGIDGGTFSSTDSFIHLYAKSYTLSVKDSKGCLRDTNITLSDPVKLGLTLSLTQPNCFGDSSGKISVAVSGGTAAYSYSLDGGTYGGSSSFSGLSAKSYTISVKDSKGCLKDSSFTLSNPTPLKASVSLTHPTCFGDSSGKVNISASGGATPYSYSLDGGTYSSSGSISGLSAKTYTLSIKDSKGCIKDTSFTLVNPLRMRASLNTLKTLCFGSSDGRLNVSISNGTAPYTYAVDGGSAISTAPLTGLSYGSHFLTIKDSNNCKLDTSFFVDRPEEIKISSSIKNAICQGVRSGKVILKVSGGTAPYLYADSSLGTFRTSAIFDSLLSGSYTFIVQDSNGCTQKISLNISDSIRLNTTVELSTVSCFGGSDASIVFIPTTGESPYRYAIGASTFRSTAKFDSLSAGTYTFHLLDKNGCSLDTSINFTEPSALSVLPILEMPSCMGKSDGKISLKGSGGTPPYSFSDDGKTYSGKDYFDGLNAKTYTVYVKDAKGCIQDTNLKLTQPEGLNFTLGITNPLCFGEANGYILVTVTGGTPIYTYTLDTLSPQASDSLKEVNAGTHTIRVTDQNGCFKDSSLTIAEPSALRFNTINIVQATCEGYTDGSIHISGQGGTSPYQYAIGSLGTFIDEGNFEKLSEGEYYIQLRDNNHCLIDTSLKLNGYPKIQLDSSQIKGTSCYGKQDGSLEIFASGGNAPLRYTMSPDRDTFRKVTYENLSAGSYYITVIDTTFCAKTFEIAVPQPDSLAIQTDIVHNDCTGVDSSGMIVANVSGGTAPYSYLWSLDNSSSQSISHLANGIYIVSVADANGCSTSKQAEVFYDNCCKPAIPNAFTPNNDGKNDVFKIIYKGDIILKEFAIYNRYGECVFRSTDINEGWDGYYKGQPETVGVYYYLAKIICGNKLDKEIFLKGDVTLIR